MGRAGSPICPVAAVLSFLAIRPPSAGPLFVKYSAADQQEVTAPTIDNSFVLPASQPTPSVIHDMVGNQYP